MELRNCKLLISFCIHKRKMNANGVLDKKIFIYTRSKKSE